MAAQRTCLLTLSLLLIYAPSGCASKSKIAKLEAENRRLAEETKAQLAELENRKAHARRVEDDLMRAEDDLAILADRLGLDRKLLANLRGERERLRGHLLNGRSGQLPLGISGQLADLASRYPSLHYDPETGISKLDIDVLFDSGQSELKPAAQRLLTEFAAVLESPEGRGLKVMVVGHTDDQPIKGREARRRFPNNWHLSAGRALAVADELRSAGLQGDRMGIAGFGMHQPIAANKNDHLRQQNRRVEIFVTSPEVPIVGMTETLTNLY